MREKRIRDTMLRFRVTPEEREAIERKMEEYGTDNMAAYLRKMAIDGYVIRLELPEIGTLTGQLGKVGSNINQIARRVNGMGHVGIEEIRLARKPSVLGKLAENTAAVKKTLPNHSAKSKQEVR